MSAKKSFEGDYDNSLLSEELKSKSNIIIFFFL